MGNKQKNRGAHPDDERLFSAKFQPALTAACEELSYLLGRGYNSTSALKIVGDRHRLNQRQRHALGRVAVGASDVAHRHSRQLAVTDLQGQAMGIDGFNLLIGVESALSGGLLFRARDGVLRDIASIHGSYRRVEQTQIAIELIGKHLQAVGTGPVRWLLDQPVSNSGRLKTRLRELAEERGWDWSIDLVFNPDHVLAAEEQIVISSDGWVMDHSPHWVNWLGYLVEQAIPEARIVDFSGNLAETAEL